MPDPSPPTDRAAALEALLARVALGDRAAFAALYRTSAPHLFGVILRIQPNRAEAEDLLQDVFVNIWRGAAGFDAARAQPTAWLSSIARYRAIDSLRRRRTEPRTVVAHRVGDDGEDDDGLDRVPTAAAEPLALLLDAARSREVTHCIDELNSQQQQCVALAFYQGLSHAQVAAHLTQPLGSVKSWIRRALQSLKECLGRVAGVGGS